jgi:hypothetical protein
METTLIQPVCAQWEVCVKHIAYTTKSREQDFFSEISVLSLGGMEKRGERRNVGRVFGPVSISVHTE